MSDDWRNELALEEQKEKLRFFGCTWDDGITNGQAGDALEECARQFPDAEAAWQKNQPATEKQKEKLRFFGCTWNGDITVGKASDALVECASQFPDREAMWESQKRKWVKIPGTFPVTLQIDTPVKPAPAKNPQRQKSFHVLPRRVTTIKSPMLPVNIFANSKQHDEAISEEVPISKAESVKRQMPEVSVETPEQFLERKGRAQDPNWQRWVLDKAKQARDFLSKPTLTYDAARQMGEKEWHEWIGLHGSYGTEPGHKLTYGDARKMSDREWSNWSVSHGRQVARQSDTVGDQPSAASRKISNNAPDLVVKEPEPPFYLKYSFDPFLPVEFKQTETENRRRYDRYVAEVNEWNAQRGGGEIMQPEPFPKPPEHHDVSLRTYSPKETAVEAPQPKTRHEGFFEGVNQPGTIAERIAEKHDVPDWRTAPATEKQKEKLRSFGCSFDAGITAGIAKLLIERHQNAQSAEPQITDFKRVQDVLQHAASSKVSNIPPNVFVKEPEPPFYLKYPAEPRPNSFLTSAVFQHAHIIWCNDVKQNEVENRRRYDKYVDDMECWSSQRNGGTKKRPEPFPEPPKPQNINPREFTVTDSAALRNTEVEPSKNTKEWEEWLMLQDRLEERQNKSGQTPSQEVTIQEASKPQNSRPSGYTIPAREVQNYAERSAGPSDKISKVATKEPKRPKYISYPREPRCQSFNSGLDFDYDYEKATANWIAKVTTIEAENRRRHDIYCAAIKDWYVQHNWNTEWEPQPFPKSPLSQDAGQQEVTIQEVVNPRIQKPTAYSYHAPIERFAGWVDSFIERNITCPSGHWLPAGPLSYVFASETITIVLCRQMAEAIEARGYCVEPDARFGNGTYDRNQTLALFKPLDDDPIQPSTAYLGAANLLRLCILITTADGKIDLVELDLFRQAIANQVGLTLTDHKRLLILEQLLAQELCSATQTAARIAKSVPADKRLVIAHLLVQVAAANNEITRDERRALERIFKAFAIPLVTLENYIYQICSGRVPKVYGDVSTNDKWLWNHWRTGHPGVVIDDSTLAGKTWNFTDWKALNARWRDLHERLVAKQTNRLPGADSSGSGTEADGALNRKRISAMEEFLAAGRLLGASGEQTPNKSSGAFGFCKCCAKDNVFMSRSPSREVRSYCTDCEGEIKNRIFDQRLDRWIKRGQSAEQFSNPVTAQLPGDFALDMERVYQITNETKEVVAILSVVMADEPEESIKLPTKITLPVPETPKIDSAGKDVPQPTRFAGLDAAFHPILERLLTRESWPVDDFDALSREFHFMPGKICETINEWSDEALGEFILDGDDPVIIRRELIAKEIIYG